MNESATLKKQFELIQLQQQQKLERLKKRKDQKEKTQIKTQENTRKTPDVLSSTAFGVDDNLDLKLADPPANATIYDEELVTHLNNQIRELKDETGRLYKLLSEKDFEIRQFRKKQGTFEKAATLKGNELTNETAATKIVELSKKVRELTAECESEKTKAKQWAKKCMDMENQLHTLSMDGDRIHPTNKFSEFDGEAKNSENEIKTLNDRIKSLESKVADYRNSSASLKQELKVAQKVLANEVGEGVTIQSLLNQPSGWRGRSQQILALQKKVQELKAQTEQQQLGTRMEDFDDELMRGMSATGSTTYRHSATTDDRQRSQIRRIEKDRKEAQEKMAAEFKALEADYDSLKEKLDASKARNKVISTDLKAQKQQVATLLEKGKHDDELVQALMGQLSQLKKLLENNQEEKDKETEKKMEEMKKASMKSQQENNVVTQLQAIVAEKEAKVKDLESEVNNIRLANLQRAQMTNVNAIFERAASRAESRFSARQSSAMIDSLEGSPEMPLSDSLIGPIGPKEPVGTFHNNEDVLSRQSIFADNEIDDRPLSRKASSRADTRLSSSELDELKRRNSELQSMYQVCEVEKNRLSQLVEVLEQRNKEIVDKELDIQKELQTMKRKNVLLEKQLGKEQVSKSGTKKSASTNKMRASMTNLNFDEDVILSNMTREELQTKLEIQQDETEALKAALQRTLKAKEEDLKLYNDIIEQTKQVFLQGLRQYRQGSAS